MYYYLLFFSMTVICLPFDYFKSKERKLIFIFILVLTFSIISGFRVGVKPDWYNYSWIFENFQESQMFNYSSYSKEPGYMLLNYIVRMTYDSKYFLFSIIAFLSISLTFFSYYRMSATPFLCILIYISFFFVNRDMGAIRAGLAYSFFLFSISYINSKSKFYILNLLGFSIHFTSILSFFIPSVYRYLIGRKVLILILLFSFLFYLAGMSDILFYILSKIGISVISNKADAYMESQYLTYDIGLFDMTNIKNLFFSIVGIYFLKELSEKNKFFGILLVVYVIGTSFRIAFSDLGVIAGRGYAIFNTVEPLIISSIVSIRMNKVLLFFTYMFIVSFSFILLTMSVYKYTTFPYLNYIFSAE